MASYKKGLDYFALDVNFFTNRKFRRVKQKYGYLSVVVYLSLLCLIYRDEGYYVPYNERTKDDVIWEVLESLQGKHQPSPEVVAGIIEDLAACELFSGDLFQSKKVLTSKRLQRQFYSVTADRKAISADFSIWLLSEEEMRSLSSRSVILSDFVNQSDCPANRSNCGDNQPVLSQRKEKQRKAEQSNAKKSEAEQSNAYESIAKKSEPFPLK